MFHKHCFKCINNIAPSYLKNVFNMRNSLSITRRKNMLLQGLTTEGKDHTIWSTLYRV